MRTSIRRALTSLTAIMLMSTGIAAMIPATAGAASQVEAASQVQVESQITAHNLPYLGSAYIVGSTLTAGDWVDIDCQVAGREPIAGSMTWYRIGWKYYPSYAFSGQPNHPSCGVARTVPLAANGWSLPTFESTAKTGLFVTGDHVFALCWAFGQNVEGSNIWFFARGYWLHSTRLSGGAAHSGMAACAGFLGNDYPYSGASPNQVDPWNFYYRECTSFAAWRIRLRNEIGFTNSYKGVRWGNAENWDNAARSVGLTVSSTPAVRTVAQTDAGTYGHVAWVVAVNSDGTVTIEEYNYGGVHAYGTRRVAAGNFVYIHFPQE
ncbi:CHAP domain-containing protein [Actinosynnema sp. NPDC050801]|uniref:CHAP domain-containing protein n=1 Tax=unclassified Actinosynnema TaxID=2637065 RepID=UPI003403A996